uniref:Uncharacterized protein n=1 Tax=Phytophthora ramorum TaxID=164328 RepID=H3H734_PHYRM
MGTTAIMLATFDASQVPLMVCNSNACEASSSSENEESPGTPLERKSFMQPTELVKQRQRQLEADASPVPPMMSPSPPSSVRSNYSSSSLNSAEEALLSDTVLTLATPDKPNADSKTPQPSSVRSHHSSSSLDCAEEALLSNTVLKLPTPDKPSAEPKSSQPSPASATDNAVAKHTQPATSHPENPIVSRTNTMCSSSSENFDCSDIDDMLEYFEGVTLPI